MKLSDEWFDPKYKPIRKSMQALGITLSYILYHLHPEVIMFYKVYELYKNVIDVYFKKRKFTGIFSSCTINRNIAVLPHKDTKDSLVGYSAIVICGNFTEGQIICPEQELTIPVQNGSIVFMKSRQMVHGVKEYTGSRNSLVFFTHERDIKTAADYSLLK
jgi:hypothetical protein